MLPWIYRREKNEEEETGELSKKLSRLFHYSDSIMPWRWCENILLIIMIYFRGIVQRKEKVVCTNRSSHPVCTQIYFFIKLCSRMERQNKKNIFLWKNVLKKNMFGLLWNTKGLNENFFWCNSIWISEWTCVRRHTREEMHFHCNFTRDSIRYNYAFQTPIDETDTGCWLSFSVTK